MIIIRVSATARVPELAITRDNTPVAEASWGVRVPIDSGQHRIRATAPNRQTWTKTIKVGLTKSVIEVHVPRLTVLSPEPVVEQRRTSRWYHDKLGWTVLALGVATALGGGVAFGYSKSLEDRANLHADLRERDRLLDQADTFRRSGVGIASGGGAIALIGAVLLAIPSSHKPGGPRVQAVHRPGFHGLAITLFSN